MGDKISKDLVNHVNTHFECISSSSAIVRARYFFHPVFKRQKAFDQYIFRLIFIKLFKKGRLE